MKSLNPFISVHVTHRPVNMFEVDIRTNATKLTEEIQGKSICVMSRTNIQGYRISKQFIQHYQKQLFNARISN